MLNLNLLSLDMNAKGKLGFVYIFTNLEYV